MDEKKPARGGNEPGSTGDEPTAYGGGQQRAAPSPFSRTVTPGADQPTPRPGQPVPPFPAQPRPPQADAPTVMMSQRVVPIFAWLVVIDGPEKGRIHQLKPDTTTVGRGAGNDVVLPDGACSGQHLKIRIEHQAAGAGAAGAGAAGAGAAGADAAGADAAGAEGGTEERFVLIDLGSRNGTYAGSKVTYRDPESRVYRHTLQDGDYLLVGETTLVFKRV
jgi:hypothetical protein